MQHSCASQRERPDFLVGEFPVGTANGTVNETTTDSYGYVFSVQRSLQWGEQKSQTAEEVNVCGKASRLSAAVLNPTSVLVENFATNYIINACNSMQQQSEKKRKKVDFFPSIRKSVKTEVKSNHAEVNVSGTSEEMWCCSVHRMRENGKRE